MTLKPERVDFTSTWSRLLKTCQEVIRVLKVDKREWNDRFSDVYKLCVAFPEPLGDRLYIEIKTFLQEHVKRLYGEVVAASSSLHGSPESLLYAYHSHWLTYREGVSYLNQLYMYLNTQHIKKQKTPDSDIAFGCIDPPIDQKLEIGELGLYLWKVEMIEPLQEQLVNLLLDAIQGDRTLGNPLTKESTVKGVILSFVQVEEYKKKGSMDLYQKAFESRFLQATGDYYKAEADRLIQESTCSSYMERALGMLDAENLRSRKYLHPSSYPRVIAECESKLVAAHLAFLHGECKVLVTDDRRRDLKNMYQLLKPVESGLNILVKDVEQHITRIGLEAVSSSLGVAVVGGHSSPSSSSSGSSSLSVPSLTSGSGSTTSSTNSNATTTDGCAQLFVESVLDVHKKYSQLIRDVFSSDQVFVAALDRACSTIVNFRRGRSPCRAPELMAKYCDSLLKKSVRGLTETEIDDRLTNSITVFKYIDDKDVFSKFYGKMFAKRLIYATCVSMEAEEAMINKLKNACGYEFTSKLHRMFTDVKLSEDLNDNFHSWAKDLESPSSSEDSQTTLSPSTQSQSESPSQSTPPSSTISSSLKIFSIFVLQAGAWPLGQTPLSTFSVPVPFERPVAYFEQFYGKKFTGRKLTWLHHMSTVELKMSFTPGRAYFVTMTTYHMAILYLFESVDRLTYQEMADHTKLSDDQLIRHLQSLVDQKILVVGEYLPGSTTGTSLAGTSASSSHDASPGPSTPVSGGDPTSTTSTTTSSQVVAPNPLGKLTLSLESIQPTSVFSLNLGFWSRRTRFRINAIHQKEVASGTGSGSGSFSHSSGTSSGYGEGSETHSSAEEDRKLYLQAAIVRIMKARKVIKHTNLVEEVIVQSKNRFCPSIPMIKKCIEALIEKGYLERTTKDSGEDYSYVA